MLTKPARRVEIKKTRRMDDRKKQLLAQWIQTETWESVYNGGSSSKMAEILIETSFTNIDLICPVEEVKISQLDNSCVT